MNKIRSKVEHNHFDYMSSAVDWEVLRVQPIRYMWNQSGPLSFFGFIAVITGGLWKWGELAQNSSQEANPQPRNVLHQMKFNALHARSSSSQWVLKHAKATQWVLKHAKAIAVGWTQFTTSKGFPFAPALRFPLALINVVNFILLADTYLARATEVELQRAEEWKEWQNVRARYL